MCGRMGALAVMSLHMKSLWLSDKQRQTLNHFVKIPDGLVRFSLKGLSDFVLFS